MSAREKILLIRFSSIGDVAQCLSVPTQLFQIADEIHWITRNDMESLLKGHPAISRTWTVDRKQGLMGLIKVSMRLRNEKFTRIYDAHNNLRSRIICWLLRFPLDPSRALSQPRLLRRPIYRWKRFLLFKFRKNTFRQPFSGQMDLLEPLEAWGIRPTIPTAPQLFLTKDEIRRASLSAEAVELRPIALVPSAAYPLKRWPLEYWKALIELLPQQQFVVFGGPDDHFLKELENARVKIFAGKLNLRETAAMIESCSLIVSNDTGVMHFAEQLGKPTIAFMGPAPFGFPSRSSTLKLERNLTCRPCSKHGQGPCTNQSFHACLRDISPAEVSGHIQNFFETGKLK